MKTIDAIAAARNAVSANPGKPATAVLLDTPDVRLVVFRIADGQEVPPHRSTSSVTLSVLEGSGIISGGDGERACTTGALVTFAPEELHGMRATGGELLLLATIAPRPGERPAVTPLTANAARG